MVWDEIWETSVKRTNRRSREKRDKFIYGPEKTRRSHLEREFDPCEKPKKTPSN